MTGGPRSCCGKKSTPKGQPVSPPSTAQDVFRAVEAHSEQRRQELLWDVEGLARLNLQIAWCRYGMDAQAKAARDATWQAKQRWMEGQANSMASLQKTGDWAATWSAVRELMANSHSKGGPASFRPSELNTQQGNTEERKRRPRSTGTGLNTQTQRHV